MKDRVVQRRKAEKIIIKMDCEVFVQTITYASERNKRQQSRFQILEIRYVLEKCQ